jgi:hypothetical protein
MNWRFWRKPKPPEPVPAPKPPLGEVKLLHQGRYDRPWECAHCGKAITPNTMEECPLHPERKRPGLPRRYVNHVETFKRLLGVTYCAETPNQLIPESLIQALVKLVKTSGMLPPGPEEIQQLRHDWAEFSTLLESAQAGIAANVTDPRAALYCRVCGERGINEKCAYCQKEREPYRTNQANSQKPGMVMVDGEWFKIWPGGRRRSW